VTSLDQRAVTTAERHGGPDPPSRLIEHFSIPNYIRDMPQSWVYMMANRWNSVLYTGVTSNLNVRVSEHKQHKYPSSFTARYNCEKLVWFEEHNDIVVAIAREKQLKNWKRAWKDVLVVERNPEWKDLSEEWVQ
jgi:putative endonuclease